MGSGPSKTIFCPDISEIYSEAAQYHRFDVLQLAPLVEELPNDLAQLVAEYAITVAVESVQRSITRSCKFYDDEFLDRIWQDASEFSAETAEWKSCLKEDFARYRYAAGWWNTLKEHEQPEPHFSRMYNLLG